ncbi:MAG: hypothetical protein AB8F78_14815 [Saprospiraceae bacterium]
MKPTEFDPRNGSLELTFTDGTSYSVDLKKKYHREDAFYVDLYWEDFKAGSTLSLALHPKAEDLTLSSCKLVWPLEEDFPSEVLTQGFVHPQQASWSSTKVSDKTPGFWKKRAIQKMNGYDPLPHPATAKGSYQSVALRDKHQTVEISSTDESAALTVFSLSPDEGSLTAENQSEGYQLRHSFPAFELKFQKSSARNKTRKASSSRVLSLAISSEWVRHSTFNVLVTSSFVEEARVKNLVLQRHESPCPGQASFDERLYSAFAKTCSDANITAGITLSPFVVPEGEASVGIQVLQEKTLRRWSPSLGKWVHPIDVSIEESMQSCEQHLLRYFRMGFRFFILQDIALSLHDGAGDSTTGQQLHQRIDLLRRILPGATVILGDLCSSEAFAGFQGFVGESPSRNQLPRLARFAELGTIPFALGKLAPFRIPSQTFAASRDAASTEKHEMLDFSDRTPDDTIWTALESTLGKESYPR